MQKTPKGKASAEPAPPGAPGFTLNYTDPGAPIGVADIAGLYGRIREALAKPATAKKSEASDQAEAGVVEAGAGEGAPETSPKAFADNSEAFGAVTRFSGTHILKIHSKNARDHVLDFPTVTNTNRPRRKFPSMNAGWGMYAKIAYQPIAVLGHDGSNSLIDHITTPNELSEQFLASFAAAFSQESLDAIIEGTRCAKTGVSELHFENLPIVYLPDGQGGEMQVTPLSPLEAMGNFKSAVLKKGESHKSPLTNQEISSKMQNISVAIGGDRSRFRAIVPNAMRSFEAAVWRYARGGRVPAIPGEEITDLLDTLQAFHARREKHSDGTDGVRYTADTEKRFRGLAESILGIAKEWIDDVNQRAVELNPEFSATRTDMRQLLLASWRGARGRNPDERNAAREAVRRALNGLVFMRTMNGAAS
ncbi:hypothetical protein [Paracoccus sp. ME4]|uniref:hypothetical protein n=1 Tax=Paracoccus sp. ME4 TaxID=3138066 RepID=UPI00398B48FB